MNIMVGEKAPLFTLYDQDKNQVSLDSFRGQSVVLFFFPLAFSSVCTEEMCILRDTIEDFAKLDTKVLAISVDSLYTLKAFRNAQGYNFPMLSDFNKETARSYDCLHEEFSYNMRGVAKRSAFVIDKAGLIRYREVLDIPSEMPNFVAVKAILEGLT